MYIYIHIHTCIHTFLKYKKIIFLPNKLDLRKNLVKCYIWSIVFVVMKIKHIGKWIINSIKVLECGSGEGWRRSVRQIV